MLILTAASQDLESLFSRFFADRPTEGRSLNQAPRPTARSTLPKEVTNFAAQYPLTTIAAIGAMATAVFLGSVGLTARLLRGGPRPHLSPALEKRFDNMERRLVKRIQDVKQKSAEGNEVTRIAAVEQMRPDGLSEVSMRKIAEMTAETTMKDRCNWEEYVALERNREVSCDGLPCSLTEY
jgi:hypothetical protein